MTEVKPCTRWAAIRRSCDGYNWIDTSTIACNAELATEMANSMDRDIPQWAAGNPRLSVEPVEIRIVDPQAEAG